MDKLARCLARIRMIRGFNHGMITCKQFQSVFALYQLDEQQKHIVFELLKNRDGPVASDEKAVTESGKAKAALEESNHNTQ